MCLSDFSCYIKARPTSGHDSVTDQKDHRILLKNWKVSPISSTREHTRATVVLTELIFTDHFSAVG
jgi:hypothetical protein